jgi:hypothetical protein
MVGGEGSEEYCVKVETASAKSPTSRKEREKWGTQRNVHHRSDLDFLRKLPLFCVSTVTWNGSSTADAIVWVLDDHSSGFADINGNHAAGPARLFAYKATATGSVSAISSTSSTSTTMPGAVHFAVPTVVEGKILIGGGSPGYIPNTGNCQAPWIGTTFQCGQLTILQ